MNLRFAIYDLRFHKTILRWKSFSFSFSPAAVTRSEDGSSIL
jgi:hypothetical protein